MSLTAFKRKSAINHGSKRSGSAPGGIWLTQGPYGQSNSLQMSSGSQNNAGFSINGGNRNKGGVGRDMKMSKSGTPYRGVNAVGFGGNYGEYKTVEPFLNVSIGDPKGRESQYIKPSVLSNFGMLNKKYKWVHGTFPNFWVQPNYTGNLTDTASQSAYIHQKAAANVCNLKVNNVDIYEGHIVKTSPTLCKKGNSTAGLKFNDIARNGAYTKKLYQPTSYDQYNLHITRACNNPLGSQKPFPFAVNRNGCNNSDFELEPPFWYTREYNDQLPSSNTPNDNPVFLHRFYNVPTGTENSINTYLK